MKILKFVLYLSVITYLANDVIIKYIYLSLITSVYWYLLILWVRILINYLLFVSKLMNFLHFLPR